MSCAFIHTAATVLFTRNPGRFRPTLEMIGTEGRTSGGVRIGFDPVTEVETMVLPWAAMPDAELDSLRNFKMNVAKGSNETFTYLSASGVATTLRFADGEIAATAIAPNANRVAVLVELP
jgi:hypothetical protein